MSIFRIRNGTLGFGHPPVLENVTLEIEENERIGLLGRNGAGKSTLMKIISGQIPLDSGNVEMRDGLKVSVLPQEVPRDTHGTVYEVVAHGLGEMGAILEEYHHLLSLMQESTDQKLLNRIDYLQHQIDARNGWSLDQQVHTILSKVQLDPDLEFKQLSGGLKRRTLLAQALVQNPDILLLDEPTNHLDINSIIWLEEFLKAASCSILFVTHDRQFLQNLSTRILDIDRGQLTSWPFTYEKYLLHKDEALAAEAKMQSDFDKKLAQEEVWIRQGVKARRTRNEGRVRKLKAMRDEYRARRSKVGSANFTAQSSNESGKLVIEADKIGFQFEGKNLFENFSIRIQRGDKIGILGPNGCGKSTLLQCLLGQRTPTQGTVRQGTQLQVAYYDQLREQLDPSKNVLDNVSQGRDKISINGNDRHIISYLQDFLFTPQRARTPVSALSGGEQNRVMLAKLFSQPANLLVMDEPTNDLDLETLDLLEDLLVEFEGTLLLVSHDRAFINDVVTSTIVFEEAGLKEYVGGYDDWLRQRTSNVVDEPMKKSAGKEALKAKPASKAKLSYKDAKELDELPGKIDRLEQEQSQLHQTLADPKLYQDNPAAVSKAQTRLAHVEQELSAAFARWEALDLLNQR